MEEFFNDIADKIRSIDWEGNFRVIMDAIEKCARKLGRATTRQVLRLYYVLKDGDLTPADKLKVYAALIYVLIPGDLLSSRIFGLLGIADDAAAVAYVLKKVADRISPEIDLKVEKKLDEWFGYTITKPEL